MSFSDCTYCISAELKHWDSGDSVFMVDATGFVESRYGKTGVACVRKPRLLWKEAEEPGQRAGVFQSVLVAECGRMRAFT